MTFFEELKIFIKHIWSWVLWFIGFSFFFSFFGLKKIAILGKEYFFLAPADASLCVQAFNKIRQDLIPPGVQLIATNPMSAFLAQISLSMLLSFLFTAPFFFYKIIRYLRPALLAHERRAVLWSLLPIIFLFFSGVTFSYLFLIPATFKILYPYTASIGAISFFSIDEFTSYVLGLTVAVGIMFLMPIFMAVLSFARIIEPDFWKKNWRFACMFFLISAAVITPDGTGITMMMLFVPLLALYFMGYVFAKKFYKQA